MKSAKGMVIRDVDNRSYLDFTSCLGVVALGHRAPVVTRAIRKQSAHLIHGMGDVHPSVEKIRLLETLCKVSPYENAKVHLSLSGSEAVEAALKTAMLATGRHNFICFEGAYHGLLMGAMTVSGQKFFTRGFENWTKDIATVLPFPDEKNEDQLLTMLEDTIRKKPAAAMILEVIQGRGGEREFSKTFLRRASAVCKMLGTFVIFDEVYTGFGRTGKLFALEHAGVVPDILCVGKSLAGGLPLSAIISEHLDVWGKSEGEARHTSTFLGHPLSCAVARVHIEEIVKQLPSFQAELSSIEIEIQNFREKCRQSEIERFAPFDVRGRGFMTGLHFGKNDAGYAVWLMEELLEKGFITLPSAERADVLSLSPPLIAKQADYAKLFKSLFEILLKTPKDKQAKLS